MDNLAIESELGFGLETSSQDLCLKTKTLTPDLETKTFINWTRVFSELETFQSNYLDAC